MEISTCYIHHYICETKDTSGFFRITSKIKKYFFVAIAECGLWTNDWMEYAIKYLNLYLFIFKYVCCNYVSHWIRSIFFWLVLHERLLSLKTSLTHTLQTQQSPTSVRQDTRFQKTRCIKHAGCCMNISDQRSYQHLHNANLKLVFYNEAFHTQLRLTTYTFFIPDPAEYNIRSNL